MAKTQLITGYYRLTDIVWEWHQALPNQDDISQLKALIAWEALVHPDHPLRTPGQRGLEVFRGIFENGEARLLFSSAQIEYIRYYLHAMKLTPEPIPLPSSKYLIKRSDLKSCVSDYYDSAPLLKKSMKTIDKTNKRLKGMGGDSRLTLRRLNFERVRSYWAAKAGTWLALDFESWEREHTMLLECGLSVVRWDEQQNEVNEKSHLVVKEYMQYQNSQYVQGNRDHFNFGQSEQVTKKGIKERLAALIMEAHARGPLFLVFHDSAQDMRDLTSEQLVGRLTDLSYMLPDEMPTKGIYVIDTVDLFAALEGSSGGNKRSLEQVCRQLQIKPVEYLHNAGNDAHYTMLAVKAMAEGGPLDAQRQERWPAFISANRLAVDLPGVDGNPEAEEIEGPNSSNVVYEPDGADLKTNEE